MITCKEAMLRVTEKVAEDPDKVFDFDYPEFDRDVFLEHVELSIEIALLQSHRSASFFLDGSEYDSKRWDELLCIFFDVEYELEELGYNVIVHDVYRPNGFCGVYMYVSWFYDDLDKRKVAQ
jgi:hypothetical protein